MIWAMADATEKEEADFSDLDDLEVVIGEYPNWLEILNSFEYGADVEILDIDGETQLICAIKQNDIKVVKELLDHPSLMRRMIHPDSVSDFDKKWADLLRGNVPRTYEYKILDPEGKERWILQSNNGVFDEKGTIVALEGICKVITRQKR